MVFSPPLANLVAPIRTTKSTYGNMLPERRVVVDGGAVIGAACYAGGPGLIPGPGQTYN
jgi:hypothetical protein